MKPFQNVEISEFFTSEERSSSKSGNLVIDENIVREESQPITSLQNQTEMTVGSKQSSSDDHNSDIIFMNEIRANYIFIFYPICNINSKF